MKILWKSFSHPVVYGTKIFLSDAQSSVSNSRTKIQKNWAISQSISIEVHFSIFHKENNSWQGRLLYATFVPHLNNFVNFFHDFFYCEAQRPHRIKIFWGYILEGIRETLWLFWRKLLMNTFWTSIVSRVSC